MSVMTQSAGYIERPRGSSLADVIDIILDKGLVIDAFVRVSLLGIELLTIDARIVVASVDTYLRFAEAVDRVVLEPASTTGVPELIGGAAGGGAAKKAAKGAASQGGKSVKDTAKDKLGIGDGDESGEEERSGERARQE